jgi:putative DNA primase/helicase
VSGADDLARKLKRDQEFDELARLALDAATTLLPDLIGGRRRGPEWVGERTAKGGPGDSWSINLKSGVWRHFAGTEHGTDIISLFAEILHVRMGAAAEDIRQRLGLSPGVPLPRNTLPYQAPEEPQADCGPIPYDAAPLMPHPDHGAPTYLHRYGDLMVVQRWDLPAGKTFSPWTWRNGGWVNKAWPNPRPLYHLEYLSQYPDATVMVVEGEKCVDRASAVLEDYVVVSWYGGAQAWKQTDWAPLQGRTVLLWPDADEPGRVAAAAIAAHLHSIAGSVRVVSPNGAAQGWDVADAIGEGWDHPRLTSWIKEHLAPAIERPKKGESASSPLPLESSSTPRADLPASRHSETPEQSYLVTLASLGLECVKDVPVPSLANVSKILQAHPIFKGHIWFDDFRGATYHTLRGPTPTRWTDAETRALTVNIQQQLRLPKFTSRIVEEGLQHAAECNRRNSLTAWLDGLEPWDGTERLDTWLADCAGVEFNDYSKAIASNWLIAMVARAYKPGCKMDNMPVLEGISGLNKTQLLEVLGDEWYKPLPMEFGSKDFLQALRGAWLVEIPDMTGFSRVAHSAILATLTIRNDTYRAPYGREPQEYARTCVFAATSETDDYLSDMRGKRRYWPLRCTDINLDTLRLSRDKLFAEAIYRYRQGDKWYVMPKEATEEEQNSRATGDPWEDLIAPRLDARWQEYLAVGHKLTTNEILTNMVYQEPGRQTDVDAKRVARIMAALGFRHKRLSREKYWLKKQEGV